MPELPEVEAARSLIAEQALHRSIVNVDDSDSYVGRPHSRGELRSALTGRSLTAAHRRGRTIWLETSTVGDTAAPAGPEIGIHLGMSGRIVVTGRWDRVAARPALPAGPARSTTYPDGGYAPARDGRRLRCRRFALRR
jgi:formamidopyrimidine-DNA glycosylase